MELRMISRVAFLLLFFPYESVSEFAGCKGGHFSLSGICTGCPATCKQCTSRTNCSSCEISYYGNACQHTCPDTCERCHHAYGHCTFGCPDGQYGLDATADCADCLANCKICGNASVCLECVPDFYGERCKPCPDNCEECSTANGVCIRCRRMYSIQQGECKACPYGCSVCDGQRTCLKCQYDFIGPTNGSCVLKCQIESTPSHVLSKVRKLCEMIRHEDGDTSEYGLSYERYKCLIQRHCIEHTLCSSDEKCPLTTTSYDDHCVRELSLTCKCDCQRNTELGDKSTNVSLGGIRYRCSVTCTIEQADGQNFNTSHCLNEYVTDLTLVTDQEDSLLCNQGGSTARDRKSRGSNYVIMIIVNVAWLSVIGIGIMAWKCCFRNKTRTSQISYADKSAQTPDDCHLATNAAQNLHREFDVIVDMTSLTGSQSTEQDERTRQTGILTSSSPGLHQDYNEQKDCFQLQEIPGEINDFSQQESDDSMNMTPLTGSDSTAQNEEAISSGILTDSCPGPHQNYNQQEDCFQIQKIPGDNNDFSQQQLDDSINGSDCVATVEQIVLT